MQRMAAEDMQMRYREMFRYSLENAGIAKMEPMSINVETDRPICAASHPVQLRSLGAISTQTAVQNASRFECLCNQTAAELQ